VRLGYATLAATDLATRPMSSWRLRCQGVEVPVEAFDADADDQLDPSDWIQFWGQALDEEGETRLDPATTGSFDLYEARDFSDENVYVLDSSSGARVRMDSRSADPTLTRTPPPDFRDVAIAEVDDLWRPLGARIRGTGSRRYPPAARRNLARTPSRCRGWPPRPRRSTPASGYAASARVRP